VFDAMLERAMRLIGAAFGIANTYDGKQFRTAALQRVPPALADLWSSAPPEPGPNSALTRLASGEDVVHIEDYSAYRAYKADEPRAKALVEVGGVRTYLAVPLRKDGQLLGTIAAYRQEVRPFTNKQIALLQNFAAQAVIAMENARLITETREALEQQTATAEVLGVINSSPGDLAPVFDAMLEKATTLCEAAFGTMFTYDGGCLNAVALRGVPAAFAEVLKAPVHPDPGAALYRIVEGEPFVRHEDVAIEAAYRGPAGTPLVKLGGARSTLAVPLRKDDELVGAFAIYRQEVRPFTDKQITFLQNFAAQAVIAMENARLITETREALAQQTATAEVLGVINSSPGDLTPVFDAILEKALFICEAAFGVLWTKDDEFYRAAALRGVPPAYAEFVTREPRGGEPGGALGRLARGEALVHVPDNASSTLDQMARTHADLTGARTVLAVPLRKDDVLLGAFVIYRQEVRPFSDKQITILQNFAAQAVIAMENARLLGELRKRTEEVAELNRGLEARVAEQVEELGRVGRLKRFLAPQLAEMIVSQGDEKILESHRREIVVVFCDLRGYTAFTETAEPEEVLDFLREYHGALGPLVSQFEGTLDQFSGDGIMVFFNDPVPIPDAADRAVKMAIAMREAASTLIADWRERGRDLGFGAGIAQGYATLGQIGFSERSGYTAIGTVCNVAARLCAEAKDGQILLSQRINVALKGSVATEQVGALALKGLTQPVVAYNVPLAASLPALRVIEGGPQTSL
jgi:class 3 adenylate cyclase